MTLITAHKILIASAVACFAFFAVWELRAYATAGSPGALATGLLSLAAAIAFGLYLRTVKQRPPTRPTPDA